jgi:hypothetical protein
MRQVLVPLFIVAALAQTTARAQSQDQSVPRLINITGVFRPADGQPAATVETVTLAIYADPQGGTALWQETQTVALDERGRYSLLLGGTTSGGIPPDMFAAGDARWLGTRFERPGEVEGARVRLTSVPYALRAANADTLGGRPASDYVLASGTTESQTSAPKSDVSAPAAEQPGTPNFLAKYVSTTDVGQSAVYETGGTVGIGTTAPFDILHLQFNAPGGNLTGLAVQNMGNSATSYSGMLFYDQNNQLGQFQGFNNVTHEYRINNIARVTPGGAFNGSINFMTGSTSRFLVAQNGNIGIGTTAPSAPLEVSNAVSGGTANMWMTSYTNAINPYYMARRSRGTPGAPSAVLAGDGLAGFYGEGYGATAFGPGFAGGVTVQAAQNWTDTAHGTALTFSTTPISSTTSATRMTLDASGNLGIGTTTTPAAGILEASNAAGTLPFAQITTTTYQNSGQGSLFVGSKARGTVSTPLAVQGGDVLAGFLGRGNIGTTSFTATRGGMFVSAAENWTNTAQGTSLNFNTTANGTITPATRVTINPSGDVGLGTPNPITSLEIVRNGETNFAGTSYNNGDGSAVFFQRARGTQQAPTGVLAGDALGYFGALGYGTTGWGNGAGVMAVVAAENWTDTANGNLIAFATSPLGTTDFVVQAAIHPNGDLGLGTPGDVNGIPTATDKLQVFGDIRVGTSGTNGCIKNFAGTGIIGTCSSDRRLKKNITPFAPMLDKVTALQPVHYFWRSDEFPDRHFGNSQSDGLIAQDVEQVMPELVATDSDGYKAIDYSKLPLLTIQAVKELKAENDARKAENDELKQRVAELERLLTEVIAVKGRQ